MQASCTTLFALTAIVSLAACGGGGGEDSGGGGGPVTPDTNGLDYGQSGQSLADAETIEITAAGAEIKDGVAVIQSGTITLGANFLASAANERNGTVTIFGVPVTITDGFGQLSTNDQIVDVFYDSTRSGTYVGAIQVVSYGAMDPSATGPTIDGETHYVFGFETDPATIDNRPNGSAIYDGEFVASGNATQNGNPIGAADGVDMDGDLTITVSFANTNTVSAVLDDATYDAGGTPITFDLVMTSTAFSGNDFSGNLTCGAGCSTSTSSIDGTFYGPNAEELGGVLALDVTSGTYGYEGVGTFIIPQTP